MDGNRSPSGAPPPPPLHSSRQQWQHARAGSLGQPALHSVYAVACIEGEARQPPQLSSWSGRSPPVMVTLILAVKPTVMPMFHSPSASVLTHATCMPHNV